MKEQRTFLTTKQHVKVLNDAGYPCHISSIEVPLDTTLTIRRINSKLTEVYKRKTVAPISDEDIKQELSKYEEVRVWELPRWLRIELRARNISFGPREPNFLEINNSKRDYQQHVKYNRLFMTTTDFINSTKGDYHV